MFDSITLYLKQERAGTRDMLAQTPVYLDKLKTIRRGTLTKYRGTLGNLSISVSERGVCIRNSLAKYYLGDNVQTLNRLDTEQAINQLSDELHLPIQKADVSRIDFAQNFIMNYKPEIYYPYLGDHQYLKRCVNPTSLAYRNKGETRKFSFYDKVAETGKKKLPNKLRESNILRYEISYKKRLGKQLHEPEITASTLFNEQFYIKLMDRYVSDYESIYKNAKHDILESFFNEAMMNTPKDVKDQLAFIGLMAIGQNRFTELVEEWRAKDVLTKPEYYSRLKRDMRKLSKEIEDSGSNPLIEELDSKVSRVKMHYR